MNRAVHEFWILRVAEAAEKNCARHLPVRLAAGEFRESSAWANYRIEQAASGETIAKVEAIAENALDAEMIGERSHDVVESLAYEYDVRAGCDDFFESSNPGGFQSWLEEILEEFFAEQVEPVKRRVALKLVKAGLVRMCRGSAIRSAHEIL